MGKVCGDGDEYVVCGVVYGDVLLRCVWIDEMWDDEVCVCGWWLMVVRMRG